MTSTQKKIPAQRWLEPQATGSLGMRHGNHALTRTGFFLCFTLLKHQWLLMVKINFLVHYPTRGPQEGINLITAGSHCLHLSLIQLEDRKNPSPVVTWTPGNVKKKNRCKACFRDRQIIQILILITAVAITQMVIIELVYNTKYNQTHSYLAICPYHFS